MIFSITLLIYSCEESEVDNLDNEENIPDTTIQCKYITNVFNDLESDFSTSIFVTYNDQGIETSYKYYRDSILDSERKNYQYDENGNLIYYEVYEKDTILSKTRNITYNECNRVLSEEDIYSSGSIYRTEYNYNRQGWELGIKYFSDGVLNDERKNYQHDENGNITYYEVYLDGIWYATWELAYNNFNKIISIESIDYLGFTSSKTITYNEQGWRIGSNYMQNDLPMWEEKNYIHDYSGNVTYKERIDRNNNLIFTLARTYECFEIISPCYGKK